jgi:hypothetical protein
MLRIARVCLLVALATPVALAGDAAAAGATTDPALQGPHHQGNGWGGNHGGNGWGGNHGGNGWGGNHPVGGGTPEPGSLLLLAGAALGYGALRRRMKR